MFATAAVPERSIRGTGHPTLTRILLRCALCLLALLSAHSAIAQSCPAGQRLMTFPAEGYFEFWRHSTVSGNRATEEWWYSESRQKRQERLPLANGSLREYFDFTAQTITIVQVSGSNVVQCDRFSAALTYVRPSVGAVTNTTSPPAWCFSYVGDENLGGLLPVERWNRIDGFTVTQDVFAQRVGDELIPLWLYNRESTNIFTPFMNFSAVVEDADLDPPCTPIDMEIDAAVALRALEVEHDLPPGTLGGGEVGQ
ncbi:MAG: hypothetical protein KDI48_11500 [Xanthomonadales bacterium]|nr:hypothetical protein [Xanthomonadales bacterium]